MKNKSIFSYQSQELNSLFEEAGNNAKVLCIPIDYAKKEHVVMFCNGHGNILRKPFPIKNSPEGLEYLTQQVLSSCQHRGIDPKYAFFGGEDVGSYAQNFVNTLRSEGWIVAGVNAHDAKEQRPNAQASTDSLDLIGIASTLLNRRANCCPAQTGIYLNLRSLTRHRKKLVDMSTAEKNRIHTVVDQIFPGFLDEKNTGISPFSNTSLYLMADRFSPAQIRRRKRQKLIETLRKYGTVKPEATADKLQHYAAHVLNTPTEYLSAFQVSLAQHIKHVTCLQDSIEQLEKEMALWLAQTQGAFLTTLRGIGIVLAAGATAEIGDPAKQKPVNNLVSYSGIIPRVKQTGGSEGKTRTGKVSKRCNRILKNYVVQSANHIGLHGPGDLMADYKRREAAGQHADFGIGRRYLRTAMCLMRTSQIYMPKGLRTKDVDPEERAGYFLMIWPSLRNKWAKLGALETAFSNANPLGRWRNMVQELYEIKLKL
jgi:transposase